MGRHDEGRLVETDEFCSVSHVNREVKNACRNSISSTAMRSRTPLKLNSLGNKRSWCRAFPLLMYFFLQTALKTCCPTNDVFKL